MSQIKILRKTISGSTPYSFDVAGSEFLIKNFSASDCYVNIVPIDENNQNESAKIPTNTAQVFLANTKAPREFNTIYVSGTGEVEVQLITW